MWVEFKTKKGANNFLCLLLKWILSVIYLWIKEITIFKVLLNLFRLCFLNCFIYGTTIAFAHNSTIFKVLLNLFRLCFLNCFIYGTTIAFVHNSTKFTFFSKLIIWILSLNIFHKKLLNICHANCSLILLNFAIPSRLLAAPTVLYRRGLSKILF